MHEAKLQPLDMLVNIRPWSITTDFDCSAESKNTKKGDVARFSHQRELEQPRCQWCSVNPVAIIIPPIYPYACHIYR